jgi:hypothetical protein
MNATSNQTDSDRCWLTLLPHETSGKFFGAKVGHGHTPLPPPPDMKYFITPSTDMEKRKHNRRHELLP